MLRRLRGKIANGVANALIPGDFVIPDHNALSRYCDDTTMQGIGIMAAKAFAEICRRTNADEMTVTFTGLHDGDVPLGDWEITARKVKAG